MQKVLGVELVSREEYYEVKLENEQREEVFYTIRYHKEENVGWDSLEVLDDEGNEVPAGELHKAIIEAFEEYNTD